MAHLASEKVMEALIICIKRRVPPRPHDLTELLNEAGDLKLNVDEPDLSDLSQYYVTASYPNAGLHRPSVSFTRPQAERAIRIAQEIAADAGGPLAP